MLGSFCLPVALNEGEARQPGAGLHLVVGVVAELGEVYRVLDRVLGAEEDAKRLGGTAGEDIDVADARLARLVGQQACKR